MNDFIHRVCRNTDDDDDDVPLDCTTIAIIDGVQPRHNSITMNTETYQANGKKRIKFTFPFWKLRKTELFYLQLFFGGGSLSAALFCVSKSRSENIQSERKKNCCFIHQGVE